MLLSNVFIDGIRKGRRYDTVTAIIYHFLATLMLPSAQASLKQEHCSLQT